MKKIKIIYLIADYIPHYGGIVTTIKEVAERLSNRGYDCTVITLTTNKELLNEEMINGVKVLRVFSQISKYMMKFSPEMYNFLKRNNRLLENADIIHLHSYHSILSLEISYYINKHIRTPLVFTPHYGLGHSFISDLLHHIYRPAGKTVFKHCNHVISVSNHEKKLLEKDFGVDYSKITVIPHGVNIISSKKFHKFNREKVYLLYVGILKGYKGIQYILGAMRILKDKFDVIPVLTIVGTGNYESKLKQIIKKLSLEQNVNWTGRLDGKDLICEYKKADIFLLLSRVEGYGIVVAEAISLGLPCIITNISALQEFVEIDGCFGIKYPPDEYELAKLIFKIMNKSIIQIGNFDTKKIRSWDIAVDEYEQTYRNILDSYEKHN